MKRDSSSRLGDQQAEGNLGNERNRNSSESGRGSESMRNRDHSSSGRSPRDTDSDRERWSDVAEEDDLIDSEDRSQR